MRVTYVAFDDRGNFYDNAPSWPEYRRMMRELGQDMRGRYQVYIFSSDDEGYLLECIHMFSSEAL